jgi:hypothetical protein
MAIAPEMWAVTKCLSSPMPVCCARVITVMLSLHTRFKAFRKCGLGLPVCHLGCLAFLCGCLMLPVLPQGVEVRDAECSLFFSVTSFLMLFSVPSIFPDSWCSYSLSSEFKWKILICHLGLPPLSEALI